MCIRDRARILMQTGNTDDAITLLLDRPSSGKYYPFYYLDYLSGLAKLNRLDDDTDRYFLKFTTNFRGSNYIKSAYQKMAWKALLDHDTINYYRNMSMVLKYGADIADGDKMAMAEALDVPIPNKCLLSARLLYDGGYYHQADSVLSHTSCLYRNDREKLERSYRQGRIAQALEKDDEALRYYEQTILLGQDENYYFAANAALQSGRIYEKNGDHGNAESSYHVCLEMKYDEYKNSISQKAKAGLNRIKEIKETDD